MFLHYFYFIKVCDESSPVFKSNGLRALVRVNADNT